MAATTRKFKVTFTAKKTGQSGPFKVKKRTVTALNKLEAEHILRKAIRTEGFDFGVVLENTSGVYRFSAMVRHPDAEIFAETKGKINAQCDADVPALVVAKLQSEGFEVGAVFNIIDAADVAKGGVPYKALL